MWRILPLSTSIRPVGSMNKMCIMCGFLHRADPHLPRHLLQQRRPQLLRHLRHDRLQRRGLSRPREVVLLRYLGPEFRSSANRRRRVAWLQPKMEGLAVRARNGRFPIISLERRTGDRRFLIKWRRRAARSTPKECSEVANLISKYMPIILDSVGVRD
jgi:hypothetical protein